MIHLLTREVLQQLLNVCTGHGTFKTFYGKNFAVERVKFHSKPSGINFALISRTGAPSSPAAHVEVSGDRTVKHVIHSAVAHTASVNKYRRANFILISYQLHLHRIKQYTLIKT